MIIDYQVIPHEDQRYPSVGDWLWCPDEDCPFIEGEHRIEPARPVVLHIRVSRLSDPRYELLVFHHELTEALLCRQKGVTQEMVDEWDKEYEVHRRRALHAEEHVHSLDLIHECGQWEPLPCGCEITETSEPGDDIHAPYYFAHKAATQCERKMAKALEVDWATYNDEVEAL